jgi:hypothetical protein
MASIDTGDSPGALAAPPPEGFRRSGPRPDLSQSRALCARLALAARGQSQSVQDGLAIFGCWEEASAVAAAVFPWAALRGAQVSRRTLQRSLRILGTRPVSIDRLAYAPRGTPARVTGRILRARWKLFSHIWSKREMTEHNVRLLTEEGHDFFLSDPSGRVALVIAANGYLIGGAGETMNVGDFVEVFGFVDRVIDPASPPGPGPTRGEPVALALRAGDQLPIILRKLPPSAKPDEPNHG